MSAPPTAPGTVASGDAAAATPPRATDLSFEQTVPRSLAHRRALGEVFVADSARAGDDEFLLALQVPRAHSLWFDRRFPRHDPLGLVEATRQGAFVVVHRYVEVPRGVPFSLRRLRFRVDDLDAFRDDEASPLQGVARLRIVDQQRQGAEMGQIAFSGDVWIDARRAITIAGDIVFMPRSDYEALRAHQRSRKDLAATPPPPPPRMEESLVGRFDERNVVLGPAATAASHREARYRLVVDPTHPSFFDHPYDHAPGPLIAEAYRQAAIATAVRAGVLVSPQAAVTACEADFVDFAEFEAVIECSAAIAKTSPDGRVTAAVGLHQLGKRIATGRMELAPQR